MRKIISLFFVLGFSMAMHAQDIIDTIAKEACDCIRTKDPDIKAIDAAQLEADFGACVVTSYSNHSEEYNKQFNASLLDQESMEALGQKVALKMFTHCPEVLMAFGEGDDAAAVEAAEELTVEGEVTDIKTEQFVTLQVKDKNGRSHNFLLLHYFDTAALFTSNEIKKKDKITVTYFETELYDPKAKEFRYFKVILGLQKI